MGILSWAIIGALLGWSIGNIAIVAGMLAYETWGKLCMWIADIRWGIAKRRMVRKWAREGKPVELAAWEQDAAEAVRAMYAALPTASEAATALAMALGSE